MVRRFLAVAAVAVVLMVATGCEPSMTITAKPDPAPMSTTNSYVRGTVTPATATAKVVLQRTVGGKWVDWQACPAVGCQGDASKVPAANVNQSTGAYAIAYPVQWCAHTLHLRVRSEGGSAFSPAFYTRAEIDGTC